MINVHICVATFKRVLQFVYISKIINNLFLTRKQILFY